MATGIYLFFAHYWGILILAVVYIIGIKLMLIFSRRFGVFPLD
jgi:hypothetical protein